LRSAECRRRSLSTRDDARPSETSDFFGGPIWHRSGQASTAATEDAVVAAVPAARLYELQATRLPLQKGLETAATEDAVVAAVPAARLYELQATRLPLQKGLETAATENLCNPRHPRLNISGHDHQSRRPAHGKNRQPM